MPSELPHSLLATAFRLNPLLTNCTNNFIEIELYSDSGKMMPIVHINQAEVKNRFLFITVHLFILLCTGRNKMYTTMEKINHTVLYNLIFF